MRRMTWAGCRCRFGGSADDLADAACDAPRELDGSPEGEDAPAALSGGDPQSLELVEPVGPAELVGVSGDPIVQVEPMFDAPAAEILDQQVSRRKGLERRIVDGGEELRLAR